MNDEIKYSKNEFEPVVWKRKSTDKQCFEEAVYAAIEKELINTSIELNKKGKFIFVKSNTGFSILGYSFKGNIRRSILIECVYLETELLSQHAVPDDSEDGITHYILITNSMLTPKKAALIHNNARSKYEFILIDQYFLYSYFKSMKIYWGDMATAEFSGKSPVSVATQCSPDSDNNQKMICYVQIRNYGSKLADVLLSVGSDQNWAFSEQRITTTVTVESNSSVALKIPVEKITPGGYDVFFMNAQYDDSILLLEFPEQIVSADTRATFCGNQNKNIMRRIAGRLIDNTEFELLYLFGSAGIGKSRIIEELSNDLKNSVEFIKYEIPLKNKSYDVMVNEIKDMISVQLERSENWAGEAKTLSQLIAECGGITNSYKLPVIILDDFHNADKKLLKEIKDLICQNHKNVKIIIVGRDDFSAGSIDYYAFKELCRTKSKENCFFVDQLGLQETMDMLNSLLIQQIEVADVIKQKICSLSEGNPLYVIQYAQYLIDCTFGSSVSNGPNIKQVRLNSKGLPKGIDEIYEARLNHLKKAIKNRFEAVITALCAMATIGKDSDKEFLEKLIPSDEERKILCERKFICKIENNYALPHETLMIYLKKLIANDVAMRKKAAAIFIYNAVYLAALEARERGKMFCWSGDYKTAYDYFKKDITDIQGFTKFSSTDVDEKAYEYIDNIIEILQCKEYEDKKTVGKALLFKIYISLHYRSPHKAIADCEDAAKLIESLSLENSDIIMNNVKILKAHAYMNSAQYKKAEILYAELVCDVVINEGAFSPEGLFDMWDRYASLCTFFNQPLLAEKYIERSIIEKDKDKDIKSKTNSTALIELTKGKLYFFSDPLKTLSCIKTIKRNHNYNSISERIRCHIDLTEAITTTLLNNWKNVNESVITANNILNEALDKAYTFTIVRAYNFLSLLYYFKEKSETVKNFEYTIAFAKKGIDACINYGTEGELYYFYNTLALVANRQMNDTDAAKYFGAVLQTLRHQNLLYIGSNELCYGNIPAINNCARNLSSRSVTVFCSSLSQVNLCGDYAGCNKKCPETNKCNVCTINKNTMLEWRAKAKNRQTIIVETIPDNFLDKDSGYYMLII